MDRSQAKVTRCLSSRVSSRDSNQVSSQISLRKVRGILRATIRARRARKSLIHRPHKLNQTNSIHPTKFRVDHHSTHRVKECLLTQICHLTCHPARTIEEVNRACTCHQMTSTLSRTTTTLNKDTLRCHLNSSKDTTRCMIGEEGINSSLLRIKGLQEECLGSSSQGSSTTHSSRAGHRPPKRMQDQQTRTPGSMRGTSSLRSRRRFLRDTTLWIGAHIT